jgi:hypothetical protein
MRFPLRKLLMNIAFGRELRGLEVCAQALGWKFRAGEGPCAYCHKQRFLFETPGPLGVGGVLVCQECAEACISISRG